MVLSVKYIIDNIIPTQKVLSLKIKPFILLQNSFIIAFFKLEKLLYTIAHKLHT